jgi:hypothetical protein
MMTRPSEDYRQYLVRDILKLPHATEILLNGLQPPDIANLIQRKFGDRAACISPDVLDVLMQRTAGKFHQEYIAL